MATTTPIKPILTPETRAEMGQMLLGAKLNYNSADTCGTLQKDVDNLAVKLNNQNSLIEDAQGRLDGHDSSIKAAQDRLDGHDSSIKDTQGRLDGHDSSIKAAQDRLDGHDSSIKDAQDRLDGHDSSIKAAEVTLGKHNSSIIALGENFNARIGPNGEVVKGGLNQVALEIVRAVVEISKASAAKNEPIIGGVLQTFSYIDQLPEGDLNTPIPQGADRLFAFDSKTNVYSFIGYYNSSLECKGTHQQVDKNGILSETSYILSVIPQGIDLDGINISGGCGFPVADD